MARSSQIDQAEVRMFYAPVALCLMLASGTDPQRPADTALELFQARVDRYVLMHRQLEGPLPKEVITADPVRLTESQRALARAIRAARVNARQGEIFSAALALFFRNRIADSLREGEVDDMLGIIEDENTIHIPAAVNGDYPRGRSIPMMPPCLLAALPPLPPELRYSFVGRDLILWDVHAGLIVDYLPLAIQ
jgi:hypothetical protein